MDNFNDTLIVVFSLLNVWFLWQIFVQIREIKISCRFMDSLRALVLAGFVVCAALLIVDLVNQKASSLLLVMTLLMALVFFQRDGIGRRGFIAKGVFIAYADVKKCNIQREENKLNVSLTYKETVRKDRKEGTSNLQFDVAKEKEVRALLVSKLPKTARINKK